VFQSQPSQLAGAVSCRQGNTQERIIAQTFDLLLSTHSEERTLLLLRPHACGERLRPTEAAITGLYERIDAVGDQSERHNA